MSIERASSWGLARLFNLNHAWRLAPIAIAAVVGMGPTASSAMPGTGTILNNTYGALTVSGAALIGNTISAVQPGAVIQLGSVPGSPDSYIEFDFQGFSIEAGYTITFRSGAPGQTIVLWNIDASASAIAGIIRVEGGIGAPPPYLVFINQNGVSVVASGAILAPGGTTVAGLGNSWTVGQAVSNQGIIDGGPRLWITGLQISGSGAYKGNAITLSTLTHANNPINGLHYLSNGLQLYPSTGTDVSLTLHAYGVAPQVLNVLVHGSATAWMPSSWEPGTNAPNNNAVLPAGGSRPPGVPEPSYGGGSMIIQATGTLRLGRSGPNDFVFPGAIVLKAGGSLDLNGVVVDQGWTTTGKQFQGVFLESPDIVSPVGFMQILTNNLNWINFSTLPKQQVRTWSLVLDGSGSAGYVAADSFAPHLNIYSVTVEAAANGQCWSCLINAAPVNVY